MSGGSYLVAVHDHRPGTPDPLDPAGLVELFGHVRSYPGLHPVTLNVAEEPEAGLFPSGQFPPGGQLPGGHIAGGPGGGPRSVSGGGPGGIPPILAVITLRADPAYWPEATPDAVAAVLPWTVSVYPIDQVTHWGYEAPHPPGRRLPGVKRMAFVRRHPALSQHEFADHWRDVHAPLARLHHPTLWRYRQNVVAGAPSAGSPPVDGIAELHFRSADDYRHRRYDSAEGASILAQDTARFLAPTGSRSVWVGEYPLPHASGPTAIR